MRVGDKQLDHEGEHSLIKRGERYYDCISVDDTPLYGSVSVVARRREVIDSDGERPRNDESARIAWLLMIGGI